MTDSPQTDPLPEVAEAFLKNAEAYCEWAEGDSHELLDARQHLLALMTSIPYLDSFIGEETPDEERERRGHEGYKEDHKRLSDLPFSYYSCIFDPHKMIDNEPVAGDLADDLADIYGDLYVGLQYHREGYSAGAIGVMVDSYFYHWGHHASAALRAIDEYYRAKQLPSSQ